ncbi:MAG TPA: ribonuclease inhibitor, partial [Rickettsia endosymbiont of Degeeriella rufa]|nr:ribonuclease inhibitor [Rickettsia endosymbiont of Degeeriella rufa]
QGITVITEALKASTQLKKLDFSGCDLGNQKISLLAEVLQLIANDANIKDKSIIEDTIKYLIQKTPLLIRTIDRDQIITDIHKLLNNKFTASKFMGIKEELEELIKQQSINDDTNVLGADSTFG